MTETPKEDPISTAGSERILAIDAKALLGLGGPLPTVGVAHHSYGELTLELLAKVQPTLVILPLFTAGHDALTVVEVLEKLGYQGRITVLAPSLPQPRLVERELRRAGPGARLTLISP